MSWVIPCPILQLIFAHWMVVLGLERVEYEILSFCLGFGSRERNELE
jgi:hypothetical protein